MPNTRGRERKESASSPRSGNPKRRTKDGCFCCRARKKKCSVPRSASEGCKLCRQLNIQCLRGYGEKRPKWMQDKRRLQEFTDVIADWTGSTNNRKGPNAPPPLVLDYFQENTPTAFASPPDNPYGNTYGPYIPYATTSAAPSTTGSISSNDSGPIAQALPPTNQAHPTPKRIHRHQPSGRSPRYIHRRQ
ncbi:hypothetical protein BS47DRAFT_135487 [Hydnum rufescens UP504]|uniref:Zn(2)-C6 fungal-type domain-containing protein n=1 Tax=Hydnum rufescens UP504 TaxID=1448309 RepID=A0A9P6APJ7_9AGAM|nr:hypothetical protein BS47DRAFT_135487 [Hydnum rufescens UP504]